MIILFVAVCQASKGGRTKVIRWRCKFLPIYHSCTRPYSITFVCGKRRVPIALCGKQHLHILLCFIGDHLPNLTSALLQCFYLCFSWKVGSVGVWHCLLNFDVLSWKQGKHLILTGLWDSGKSLPDAIPSEKFLLRSGATHCLLNWILLFLCQHQLKVINVNHAITWAIEWGTTSESHFS